MRWENGKVIKGEVEDSGKMLVVPLYSCRVWLSRKTSEIRNRSIVETFIKEAKKHSPSVRKINYKKCKDGCLLELAMPDMQLGRLVVVYGLIGVLYHQYALFLFVPPNKACMIHGLMSFKL